MSHQQNVIIRLLVLLQLMFVVNCTQSPDRETRFPVNNTNIKRQPKKIVCYWCATCYWSSMLIEKDLDPNICTHIIYAYASFDNTGIHANEGK